MASVNFSFAMSHGPLLALQPSQWDRSRTADMMEIRQIDFRGRRYTYEELLEFRRDDRRYFASEFALPSREKKFARMQRALDSLADSVAAAKPDVLIVIGDDHYEFFNKGCQPSFAVFAGESLVNPGFDPQSRPDLPEAIRNIIASHNPPEDQVYPCQPDLALEIVRQASADGLDLAASLEQPVDDGKIRGIGHCVGFPYRRVLHDKPVNLVPVLMNTYFPPNQPAVARCFKLGESIGRAIRNWDSDKTVALVGSGGLSHFAIDEEWDQEVIEAFKNSDFDYLLSVPENVFQSGSSEVKNWITAAAAVRVANPELQFHLVDYVPCYRSEGGTGTAAGFATWQ